MKTTVFIKLEIEAPPAAAFSIVDGVLDDGSFQEAINEQIGRDRVLSVVSGDAGNARDWIDGDGE